MSGWHFGGDKYPEGNNFSLESFSRHIRSGRLDINTRTQCICLIDANNTDIFDGDIIRSFDSEGFEVLHLIEYGPQSARFVARYNSDANGFRGITQEWIQQFKKSVVGNKFEHAELLERGLK